MADTERPSRPTKRASRPTRKRAGAAKTAETPARASAPAAATETRPARPSSAVPAAAPAAAPLGLAPTGLGADVTGELAAAAPTFGEVLESVGLGVAFSQRALDEGVRESAKALADKKVRFVNTVITELDDDGLPVVPTVDANGVPSNVELVDVSAINFFSPTVHEWKHVALSMDLTVGALDATQGFSFKRSQASVSAGGGTLWGFIGWFNTAGGFSYGGVTATAEQEANWSQGTVRLDAQLGPRRTERLPIPGRLTRGPGIYFVAGPITETAGVRKMAASVQLRKTDGSLMSSGTIAVSAPGLQPNFPSGANIPATGLVKVDLVRRDLGDPKQFSVEVRLGDFAKTFAVTL